MRRGGFVIGRVALAPLVAVLLLSSCGAEPSDDPAAGGATAGGEQPTGTPAPNFTLPDLDGNPVTLADYRGKVVIVDFWATWCPPCLFQVPELNAFWEAHREKGDVAVIGIAVDVEGAEVVAPWVEEQGVEYTILVGEESLAKKFGAMGFPTLAIVTRGGSIDSLHVGLVEHAELEKLVAPLAAAPGPS